MKYIKLFEDIDWIEDWEEEDPYESKDIPIGEPTKFYEQYIGRKVMIRKDSMYYDGYMRNNPKDIIGTITTIVDTFDNIIRVDWGSFGTNIYRPEDLMLV